MTLDTPDDLSGLFAPTSVAVVGASSRAGRPGRQVIENLQLFDPTLAIYPITPRYDEVLGLTTYPDLASSPGADLVVLAGSSDRAEGELEAAIAHGARGVLVFGAPAPGAIRPPWLARLGAIAKEGGVPMLGPDTLGYVNYAAGRGVTWALPEGTGRGGVAVVSQSGTVFWEGITCDPRMRFSFAAHSGLEASTTISDLVKYAVCLESTRVLGLYVETVRDPDDFLLSLELAEAAEVPVVAMYAGRTDKARRQLMTHAGRLAGDHATFEAVFRRHGVARAHTSDEWWTTLTLLGSDRRVGEGGLAAVMDSGGGLAMFLDYADELGLPLADLRPATVASIQDLLGHEILAEGAIDFWVGDSDRHARTEVLLDALVEDETTAAVMAFTTYGEATTAGFATPIAQACAGVAGRTGKPVVAATYTARQLYPGLMLGLAEKGVPVLDGMRTAMQAFQHAFAYRDFLGERSAAGETDGSAFGLDDGVVESWERRLAAVDRLDEMDALDMLSTLGIPCVPTQRASTEDEAAAAARTVGFPVVVKTDEGLAHKSALGGVRLSLSDEAAVRRAYSEMVERLGPRVIVAPMADGLEVAIGVVVREFGPMVMIGTGGVLIEHSEDRCHLLAPAGPRAVARAMEGLEVTRLLRTSLGAGSAAEQQLHEIVSRVATVAVRLGGVVTELDINPILVSKQGCLVVDALVGTATGALAGRPGDPREDASR